MHDELVPEPKVRKEISRHVPLSSQHLGMGVSGMCPFMGPSLQYLHASRPCTHLFIILEPKTPEGIVVGTPREEVDGIASDNSSNLPAIDWNQALGVDFTNFAAPACFQPVYDDPISSQLELPGLSLPELCFQGNEEAAIASSNLGDAAPDVTPTSTYKNGRIQYNPEAMGQDVVEETRLTLLEQVRARGCQDRSDLVSALEPITIGDVNSDLTSRAETIFQSTSPDKLSHYLNLCIYLSSNNLMSTVSTNSLVSLIAKSGSHLRLKTLLKSTTPAIEIFMSNLLASAAALGDVEITRILIESGADLDASSGLGMRRTALDRALGNDNIECVRMLLEAGADSNLAVDGKTPLHTACSRHNSLDCVDLLLRFGALVNPPQDSARLTPLQLAVRTFETDSVQLLFEKKANPNSFTTSKKGTALQMACSNTYTGASMVELLIDAGADIESHSGYRCDKLVPDYLLDSRSDLESEEEEESEEDCPIDCIDLPNSFKPPILIAAENENWEVVQLLLEEGAAANISLRKCPREVLDRELDELADSMHSLAVFTPLQAVVRAENITMTRMLLSAGAHLDGRPKGMYGHTALQICAMVGNERLAKILLRKGAGVKAPAGVYSGRTALQAAAIHSDTRLLSILLREGADVNAPPAEINGKTALQIAVAAGNTEGVRILLEAKAAVNPDPQLTKGVTALTEAIRLEDSAIKEELVYQLVQAGAYVDVPKNQENYAPLHVAVERGDLEMTRKLLKGGANPNGGFCANRQWLTPLQQASRLGQDHLVQLLIDYGAEVNGLPFFSRGRTALQEAASWGHVSVVKLLLTFGAKINLARAEYDGISAIEAAAAGNHQGLVQLFLGKEPDIISSDPVAKGRIIGLALGHWKCDVAFLELLLKGGAVVDNAESSQSEMPLLQKAVRLKSFREVQFLVAAGAEVSQRWERNYPGNVTALQESVSKRNIDIAQLLLDRGADVNAPANKNGGKTALQTAVSQKYHEMVGLLVQHGADVNGLPCPVRGRTALQEAASSGLVQLTQYLLTCGANVNAPAARLGGVTALQGAALNGYISIVLMLLRAEADVNGAPAIEQGRNAIEGAAENGRLHTLILLLNHHPDTEEFEIRKKRASKLALANGHLAIGRFLLAYRKHTRNA